ncbi:MAG: epoxyqueuosine reductase [Chloroflexi bacterium]|nr:epoxyqueuosine reductase [Chloroflexota bacterium]
MNLRTNIQEIAEHWGINFFGVADLTVAHDAILAQGGPVVAEYPRAISMGIELPHSIVNQLPRRTELAVAASYRSHGYGIVNQRLDLVASQVFGFLQKQGYDAMPIPASQRVSDDGLCGVFSHKMAAHLAGLGWIGKSCLLVTPEAGPRVRWTTVLTDAPLAVTGERLDERCGDCVQCVEICPVRAFTGQAFRHDEPREARYDAAKCDRYFAQMREKDAETAVCGLCLYVCPHGNKQKRAN